MARITTKISIAMAGGKTISVTSGVIDAEATGQIDVDLPDDGSEVTVEIQPGAASQLHALLLSSSYYGPELTYVFSDGTTKSSPRLTLDAPRESDFQGYAAIVTSERGRFIGGPLDTALG